MTREQLNGPKLERSEFAAGTLESLKPLDYSRIKMFRPETQIRQMQARALACGDNVRCGTGFLDIGDADGPFRLESFRYL